MAGLIECGDLSQIMIGKRFYTILHLSFIYSNDFSYFVTDQSEEVTGTTSFSVQTHSSSPFP